MEALKLILVFLFILAALRRHVPVGITLLLAGLLTAWMFGIGWTPLIGSYKALLQSHTFISLTAIILLITALGSLMKDLGYLERMADACLGLYGGRRTAAMLLPSLVGLLPMPGGSLLSAPLVDEVLDLPAYTPEFKCAVNYWSRHVVEHVMPIYPGLIVSAAVTGLPIGTISMMQLPLSIAMLAIGYVFLMRKIDRRPARRPKDPVAAFWQILSALWPVILAIGIYGIFEIDLAYGAAIALVLLVVVSRPGGSILFNALKKGLNYKLIILVFGVLSFQTVLEGAGAVESLKTLAETYNLPDQGIIVAIAFVSGLLTGMLAALVALSYSLLAGFLYQPEIQANNILLAFISGYIGHDAVSQSYMSHCHQ